MTATLVLKNEIVSVVQENCLEEGGSQAPTEHW